MLMAELGIPTNTKYSITTRLMYPRIAWNNFDHFGTTHCCLNYIFLGNLTVFFLGQDALSAYTACHSVALDLAAAGGGEEALKEAYFMDGFGLHFLTDIFSSGHVRVPRRALHDADWWSALPGI